MSPISLNVERFHDLHFYIRSFKRLHYVEWEFQSLLGLCESLVGQCAYT